LVSFSIQQKKKKIISIFFDIKIQVFVVAIQNRKLPIPENAEELHEIHDKETRINDEILQRTEQFRYVINIFKVT
jgi:hypothetical protein